MGLNRTLALAGSISCTSDARRRGVAKHAGRGKAFDPNVRVLGGGVQDPSDGGDLDLAVMDH
jgi:hypothetical protein